MKELRARDWVLLLHLLATFPALGQTVYKTVEDGVVSFSDTPPEDGAAEVLTVDVPPPADDGVLEERLAEMRETTDRMADDRRAREKHRAEMRALNAPEPEPVVIEQPVPTWAGGYWPRNRWPAHRPPYRPGRPQPTPLPAASPPPGWSVMQPGNSQLMRPIVSSRRGS